MLCDVVASGCSHLGAMVLQLGDVDRTVIL